jgi:hypothetical protein
MQEITIATFNDRAAAERLKDRFLLQGIPARLSDERKLQSFWFLSRPHAAIGVRVATRDYAIADAFYHELDTSGDHVLCPAVRCPQCRSSRVEYPQMTRFFILPTLLGHLAFLFGWKRKYYCQGCHHTWLADQPSVPGRPHVPEAVHPVGK